MNHPSFYRIKISKVQTTQRPIPFVTLIDKKKDEVFYSAFLGDEVAEEQTIVKMRSTGEFTNRPQVTQYRFAFIKVSCANVENQLVLCTRFYKNVAEVFEALRVVMQMWDERKFVVPSS